MTNHINHDYLSDNDEPWIGAIEHEISFEKELGVKMIDGSGYIGETLSDNNVLSDKRNAMELAIICAQDIVAAWPSLTMRTLASMTNRIDTLRQALEEAAK